MTATVRTTGENSLYVDYDRSLLLLGNNKTEEGVIATPSGADLTITQGQLLGRIAADNTITVLTSAAVDGSQYPVGIAIKTVTVADGTAGTEITFCTTGTVNESLLVFDGTDTIDTVVELKTLRDRLKSDTLGIDPELALENTYVDN